MFGMRMFFDIARMLPAVILLTFAVVGQSFAMSYTGTADHSDGLSKFTYVICADGQLKTLTVDTDDIPHEHHHSDIHCPLCVLGKTLAVHTAAAEPLLVRYPVDFRYSANLKAAQVHDLCPDALNCLDPPSA